MSLISTISLSIVLGVCLISGITHLIIGIKKPKERIHRLFASLCFLISVNVLIIVTPQSSALILFLEYFFGFAIVTNLLVFSAYYSKYIRVKYIYCIVSVTALTFFVRTFDLINNGYDVIVVNPETSTLSFILIDVSFFSIIIYIFFAVRNQYLQGEKKEAVILAMCDILLAAIFVTENLAIIGVTGFLFSTYYFFVGIIVLMSVHLANQITITENNLRKREHELFASERYLDSIIKTVPDIIYRLDSYGIIIFINESVKTYGYEPTEMIGKSIMNFVHSDDSEEAEYRMKERRTGDRKTQSYEIMLISKNRETVLFEVRKSQLEYPVFLVDAEGIYGAENSDKGKFIGTQGIARDITERKIAEKKREEALLIAEKSAHLTSLGTMAAGISHEINQPLTALKIKVDSMLYWNERNGDLDKNFDNNMFREHLHFVSEQTSRIDNIVQQVRALAIKDRTMKEEKFDVNEVIKKSLNLMQQQMSARGIKLALNFKKDLPKIIGQKIALQQVIINIIINARDALSSTNNKKKTISITTSKDKQINKIEISDNGPGIKKENLDRLFEPFFSTKESSEGMGLGLSIVQSSVSALGGLISVRNNGDQEGVCFTILLPSTEEVLEN